MHTTPKCSLCRKAEAVYAMQFMGDGGLYKPTFTTLGSHYRGFKHTKVCPACKDRVHNMPHANQMALFNRLYR